eukprot:gene34410-44453_t
MFVSSLRRKFSTKAPEFIITGSLLKVGPTIGSTAELRHTFSQEAVNTFADDSAWNSCIKLILNDFWE